MNPHVQARTRRRCTVLAAVVLASLQPALGCAQDEALLTRARVTALPEPERAAWLQYLEASARLAELDRRAIDAELALTGRPRWTPAPAGDAFTVDDAHPPEWYRSAAAHRTADILISFQTPAGGWSKRVDYGQGPRQRGMSYSSAGSWTYVGTFDNDATTEQLRFLARIYQAEHAERHRAAYLNGLEYILGAQFPNGCWPQVFPLQGGYHDAATFNDDAIVRVLGVLHEAVRDSTDLVPAAARTRASDALARGIRCVLHSQVVVAGVKTVWGAQHDPISLRPVRARAYEHASLSGAESAGVMRFLMRIDTPAPAVGEAVHAAAAWFRATAIRDFDYESKGGLMHRPGAGPIWARFYEIGTNRPIFSNRDGIVRYDFRDLDEERRLGYAWYSIRPVVALRAYDRWARRHANHLLLRRSAAQRRDGQ